MLGLYQVSIPSCEFAIEYFDYPFDSLVSESEGHDGEAFDANRITLSRQESSLRKQNKKNL